MHMEKATFAAGCFWGVEAAFRKVEGVTSTTVGYAGGHLENPTYEDVCSGRTGHAEAVLVEYDPAKVSYEELLDVFWNVHDPRVKPPRGAGENWQYRSAIFYHNSQQRDAASLSKHRLEKSGPAVVTQIHPAPEFYPAEEYHQQYYEKHGPSCGTTN